MKRQFSFLHYRFHIHKFELRIWGRRCWWRTFLNKNQGRREPHIQTVIQTDTKNHCKLTQTINFLIYLKKHHLSSIAQSNLANRSFLDAFASEEKTLRYKRIQTDTERYKRIQKLNWNNKKYLLVSWLDVFRINRFLK